MNTVNDIKRVSINYCKNLLTNRQPNEGFEEDLRRKFELHEFRMTEHNEEDEGNLTTEMFNNAIKRVKEIFVHIERWSLSPRITVLPLPECVENGDNPRELEEDKHNPSVQEEEFRERFVKL